MNETIKLINMEAFVGDEEIFSKTIRTLLTESNIVRNKDEASKRMYRFAIRPENMEKINEYLKLSLLKVESDEDGVLCLSEYDANDNYHSGRRIFNKGESMLMCVLASIYLEKEKTSTKDIIYVTMQEVHDAFDKYQWLDYFNGNYANKTYSFLKTLSRYNLIGLRGKLGREDFIIEAYPSLKHLFDENKAKEYNAKISDENKANTTDSMTDEEIEKNQVTIDECMDDADNQDAQDNDQTEAEE